MSPPEGPRETAPSSGVGISGDGSVVAFFSSASNLVPGDANGVQDVFVHDRDTGVTERVSVSSDEEEAYSESSFSIQGDSSLPQLSFDGTMVSFDSGCLQPGARRRQRVLRFLRP